MIKNEHNATTNKAKTQHNICWKPPYTRQKQTKQKQHNMCWTSITIHKTQDEYKKKEKKTHTICVGHHYAQTNTNNVNKT
jgi:uncharacterized protein YhjY with autotransporter beta-barrel domain